MHSNVLVNFNSTGFLNYQLTIAVTNQITLHVFASMVTLSVSDVCWLLSSFLALKSSEQTISCDAVTTKWCEKGTYSSRERRRGETALGFNCLWLLLV